MILRKLRKKWAALSSLTGSLDLEAFSVMEQSAMCGNSQITIGEYTYGFESMRIRQWGEGSQLTIGKFCSLGSGLSVYLGGNHDVNRISTYPFGHIALSHFRHTGEGHPLTKGDVVIGHDVWIGENVTIMSGVTVGHGAVIGAHSVVSKNVAAYSIVAGNPARFVRTRFDKETTDLLLAVCWWNRDLQFVQDHLEIITERPNLSKLRELLSEIG